MPENPTDLTSAAYDAYADRYARRNASIDPIHHNLAQFIAMLGPDAAILDVGCGAGRDCAYFTGQGYRVFGLDRSAGQLMQARQVLLDGRFMQGDMRTLPFADGTFDGLWVCASLLHLPKADAPSIMAELMRLLRPGGVLYVAVKRGEGEHWVPAQYMDDAPRFFVFYTPDELTDLLAHAEFTIDHTAADDVWVNVFARKLR